MSVRYALLALLSDRSLSGYELKSRFDRMIGDFWQLNSGQIYTTLERMRLDGLVERRPAPVPACPDRSSYTMTGRGRELLHLWFKRPYLQTRPFRDAIYIRLTLTPQEFRHELFLALGHLEHRYRQLQEAIAPLLTNFPLSPSARARWFVVDAARMQIETEIRWLSKVQQSLAPQAKAATG